MKLTKVVCAVVVATFAAAAFADVCMLKSESTSGMNKTCVYRCTSGAKSITIPSTSLCPLTIG